jgi:hypothetical protein
MLIFALGLTAFAHFLMGELGDQRPIRLGVGSRIAATGGSLLPVAYNSARELLSALALAVLANDSFPGEESACRRAR